MSNNNTEETGEFIPYRGQVHHGVVNPDHHAHQNTDDDSPMILEEEYWEKYSPGDVDSVSDLTKIVEPIPVAVTSLPAGSRTWNEFHTFNTPLSNDGAVICVAGKDRARHKVTLKAKNNVNAYIYIGDNGSMNTQNSFLLAPGDSLILETSMDIYAFAPNGGNAVLYVATEITVTG